MSGGSASLVTTPAWVFLGRAAAGGDRVRQGGGRGVDATRRAQLPARPRARLAPARADGRAGAGGRVPGDARGGGGGRARAAPDRRRDAAGARRDHGAAPAARAGGAARRGWGAGGSRRWGCRWGSTRGCWARGTASSPRWRCAAGAGWGCCARWGTTTCSRSPGARSRRRCTSTAASSTCAGAPRRRRERGGRIRGLRAGGGARPALRPRALPRHRRRLRPAPAAVVRLPTSTYKGG